MASFSFRNIDISSIIDLERYPILDLNNELTKKLIFQCQKDLESYGAVSLDGFVRTDKIDKMADEVSSLCAFNRLEIVSPYQLFKREKEHENLPSDHPLNRRFVQDVNAVAADCIPQDSLLQQVYDSKIVADFLARVLQIDNLFKYADEFQGINVMYMYDGGSRAWHFDGSDFVVTLMLRPPKFGGEFEFVPFIRGERKGNNQFDERFDDIQKVYEGIYPTQIRQPKAGSLNLFSGLRSLHRVRTVYGPETRIMAVLSYDSKPDQKGQPRKNAQLYGERVKKIYESRGISV